MTDTLTPFGFRPSRRLGSDANNMGVSEYRVSNGQGGNIFYGDPVTMDITAAGGGITQASVCTDWVQGIFLGCRYIDSTTRQPTWSRYFPSGTSSADSVIRALVMDNPDATFEVQCNASVTAGDIGYGFGPNVSAGDTLYGRSAYGIAAASRTVSLAPYRIIGLVDRPDNTFGGVNGAFPIVEVQIVQHAFRRLSFGTANTSVL